MPFAPCEREGGPQTGQKADKASLQGVAESVSEGEGARKVPASFDWDRSPTHLDEVLGPLAAQAALQAKSQAFEGPVAAVLPKVDAGKVPEHLEERVRVKLGAEAARYDYCTDVGTDDFAKVCESLARLH